MRGRIKLHNLGTSFFSEEFERLRKDYDEKLKKVAEDLHDGLRFVKDSSEADAEAVEDNLSIKIRGMRREVRQLQDDLKILKRQTKNSVDSLFQVLAYESSGAIERVKSQSLLLTAQANENLLEVMRQNVYLIEYLREVLGDKEPKYDPRRWYDHGWR